MPRRRSPGTKRSSSGKKRTSGKRRQVRSYRYRAQGQPYYQSYEAFEAEIAQLEDAITRSGWSNLSNDTIQEMKKIVGHLRMHMAAITLKKLSAAEPVAAP